MHFTHSFIHSPNHPITQSRNLDSHSPQSLTPAIHDDPAESTKPIRKTRHRAAEPLSQRFLQNGSITTIERCAPGGDMPSHPSAAQSSPSRDRLLQAAKRLFATHGYEQTATSAIAREAGTSESQLMRYFGSKIGLLEALFDEAWTDLNTRLKRVLETARTTREAILAVVETVANTLAKDPDLATLLLFESRRLRGEEPRVRLSTGFVAFTDLARSLVRRGQTQREIDSSLDTGAVTSAIIGATEALIRDRLLARAGGGRSFAEREIHRTLDAMMSGFAVRTRARRGRSARSARR